MVGVFLSYGSPVAMTKTRLFLVFLTVVGSDRGHIPGFSYGGYGRI